MVKSNKNVVIDNYLVYSKSQADFVLVFKCLIHSYSWNPHAKFLVYINAVHKEEREILFVNYIKSELWKHLVMNAVVVMPNINQTLHLAKVGIYLYFICMF